MSLSFFAPKRTVLLVADEALYIFSSGGTGALRLVETVPWDAADFAKNVAGVIAKDCKGHPVLILNDMVEQHYRKEKVIKAGVGVLDKASMIQRKLNVAFPNYPIRAAYGLKEKAGKNEGKLASDVYIFAALGESEQLNLLMEAVRLSYAPIVGLYLLPVESAGMVKALSEKLEKKSGKKASWSLFMGQHKSGGLRQIVIKNGELALTRMTPITGDADDPDLWAQDVYREFKATMSYLARFGYQPNDGLDIITICHQSAGDVLERLIQEPCNFYSLTLPQAGNLLNLPSANMRGEIYADTLHVNWTARKSRFALPMTAQIVEDIAKPRKMAMVAALVLFLTATGLGYQVLANFQNIVAKTTEINDARNRFAQLEAQYQREVQRKEEMGIDIKLVQSSIAFYEELEKKEIKPLALFQGVGKALGSDLRIDGITVARPGPGLSLGNQKKLQSIKPLDSSKYLYQATLRMTYPSTTDVVAGNKEVLDLKDRIQQFLPQHEVAVTKLLKDYEYVEDIVVETGDLETENIKQDFIAELVVKGLIEE